MLENLQDVLDGQVLHLLEWLTLEPLTEPPDACGLTSLRCTVDYAIEFVLHHLQQLVRVWRDEKDLVHAIKLNGTIGIEFLALRIALQESTHLRVPCDEPYPPWLQVYRCAMRSCARCAKRAAQAVQVRQTRATVVRRCAERGRPRSRAPD